RLPSAAPFPYTTLFRSVCSLSSAVSPAAFSDGGSSAVDDAPFSGSSARPACSASPAPSSAATVSVEASSVDRRAAQASSTALARSEEHTSELQSREKLV